MNCQNDVLKTLLYYDVFSYPLTLVEIISFSIFSKKEITKALSELQQNNIVYQHGSLYSLKKDVTSVLTRKKGNKEAKKIWKKAKLFSAFIGQFPFVEAVFISGSLSKGFFGKGDDIDYFIITNPNRIWITRTLLIGFKKIFLLNSKKYFCVNYFMSSNSLEVDQKNRFTATEFATLIPMNGNGMYKKLQDKNQWVLDYFPNYNNMKKTKPLKRKRIKRFLEFLLKGKFGGFFEKKFMYITKKHQRKKFNKLGDANFEIAFRGDENTSKHHPHNHQIKVIEKLNEKINSFNETYSLNIPLEY